MWFVALRKGQGLDSEYGQNTRFTVSLNNPHRLSPYCTNILESSDQLWLLIRTQWLLSAVSLASPVKAGVGCGSEPLVPLCILCFLNMLLYSPFSPRKWQWRIIFWKRVWGYPCHPCRRLALLLPEHRIFRAWERRRKEGPEAVGVVEHGGQEHLLRGTVWGKL